MAEKLINKITYISMVIMAVVLVLMWTDRFPMQYSFVMIIFASIVLLLRIGLRLYNLIQKK